VNNVDDVPSVKSMQTLNAMLQKMCGIDSIKYKGALGHTYYVNSLAQIIAQVCHNIQIAADDKLIQTGNGQPQSLTTSIILSRRPREKDFRGTSSLSVAARGS
jgi:hypothetical protein